MRAGNEAEMRFGYECGVCPDPDDEKFLACALASGVTVLVSGDKHLLNMKQYESVRILTAKTFYKEISVTC